MTGFGTPAPSVLAGLRQSLVPHAPFSAMADADLEMLVRACSVRYYAAGDSLLSPSAQRPSHAFIVRSGCVRSMPAVTDASAPAGGSWERGVGEVFPLSALLQRRGVTRNYVAVADTFVLAFTAEVFDALVERSPVFADFCRRRVDHLLELSHSRMQAEFVATVTESRGPATPLASVLRNPPLTAPPSLAVGDALREMEARRVGSIITVDEQQRPLGILTRQDIVGRIVLPALALDARLDAITTQPVVTLDHAATTGDAALEMARHGIRHIVVTDNLGRVAGVVSERDLFALQRLSVRELASGIRRARDVDSLVQQAADIRALAHALVAQGMASDQLTRMISSLNDQLLQRLIEIVLPGHALDDVRFCWLGMGSEGRSEQTIATDQDNGILFDSASSAQAEAVRARLLPFARAVNEALDRCGYPLCKGNVMAMNPRWCASFVEWQQSFHGWIDRGDPQSLLDAQIFFDFRSLWGEASLAHRLREDIAQRARGTPRFLKQMSDNALARRPALNWFGELAAEEDAAGTSGIDLKLQGTVLFVDAARILALASGVAATSTAERLANAGAALGIASDETRAWSGAFEYLQLVRLRTQNRRATGVVAASTNANFVPVDDLSELDRRILKEAMRQGRRLQQRLALDYPG